MHKLLLNSGNPVMVLLIKEFICEYRSRYALSILFAFSIVTVTGISISLANSVLLEDVQSVFLWLIIFFAAMAGLGRVYTAEKDSSTLAALQVHCSAQSIIFAKTLFNAILFVIFVCFMLPLFAAFFSLSISNWQLFGMTVLLGVVGIASVSTLMAAISVNARGAYTLLTVISFPVLLPLLLNAINLTTCSLQGNPASWDQIILLAGFDMMIIAVAVLVADWL